ncbi:MAG: protein translocase subunit SecD, partial [Cryobacterium sp.]|nr:protein translocase subunit SecD [Cryobacterium sp.]
AATSSANTVVQPSESPSPTDAPDEESSDEPTGEPSSEPSSEPTPTVTPTDASDDAWITPALQDQFNAFDCKNIESSGANVAPTDEPLITCDVNGIEKYILGPVEVSGETISDASAGLIPNAQGATTNEWGVNLVFNAEGAKEFGKVTTRLYGLTDNKNRFAIVLDGSVISAPTTRAVITDGKAQISGNFTQQSAKVLADQLKFGALPIGFEVQSSETISATLGTSQLQSGLLAGILGLILVMIYTMFQYRALGSVTIASLVVAGIMTYLVITILSWREGYRLSLAGVAGLIVAIGFTADSFIIYFERVRDELREGRVIVSAVEAGWKRALKTVYAAKGTNLLAAIVLFIVAVGNVRGFALTLGITTIIDVIIVILFTHPMLQLLARTKFFGDGHPLSGLDPMAHGAVYRGAGEFRVIKEGKGKSALSSSKEAARRQTIAERKAAEAAELAAKGKK